MTRCSVPLCSHNANHHFPKDPKRRHLWLKAIERDDFVPKSGARICRRHFHRGDFVQISHVTGRPLQRKCLKKSAVPSVFAWNRKSDSSMNTARGELRKRHHHCNRFNEIPAERHYGDDTKNVSFKDCPLHTDSVFRPTKKRSYSSKTHSSKIKLNTQETQTLDCSRLFATSKQLLSDDESVLFYTGLENHTQFILLLSTLLPMANEIQYQSETATNLTVEDQFLILLIKLRRSKPDFEIGKMFGVNKADVYNVIVTWVCFVTDHWSLLDSWPNQNVVDSYMPQTLKSYCPSSGMAIDAEVPVKKESSFSAEKAAFSQYRLKNNLKFIAGCTSDGLITYSLETEEALPITGFKIRDGTSMSGIMNVDHKLAKTIPMEKLIGSTKTFKILASALNEIYAPLSPKIFSVCLMISSIKVGIVTVNKDPISYQVVLFFF